MACEVAAGEVFGLAGPNGSGKTTLLQLLAGLRASGVWADQPVGDMDHRPLVVDRAWD